MAEDDIVVKIGVDTSALDAGMARVKQETAGVAGAAGAGVGAGVGGTAGVARIRQVTGATNELSEAQDRVAASSGRAGSAFEGMLNRMMMRMGILLVIHEAIKAVIAALQESVAYETARVRFENLSTAVEGAAKAWEHLRQVAHETGIPQEELSQAQMSLEKMGVSGREVGGVMENLAKYSKITGENVGTLAQEWARVERKEGSVKDMQDLAYATHDINLQRLVNDLAETQRMAPFVAQQQAEIDKQINRAAEDTDRLRLAQIGVAEALHLAGKAYQEFIDGGRQGGVAGQLAGRLRGELAVGAAQLAQEGEPTVQQMRSMGASGKEIYQILMQAAERYHERVRELMRRQEEDAREAVRLKAMYKLLEVEEAVAQAIEKGVGASSAFAKVMDTAAGLADLIKEHIKEIVDDATIINDAIKGWGTAINQINLQGIIDNVVRVGKAIWDWYAPIKGVTDRIDNSIYPAVGKVMEAFKKIDWDDMINEAKRMGETIAGWLAPIQGFIDGIKALIGQIQDLLSKIPVWHPAPHDPTLETPEQRQERLGLQDLHHNRVPGFLGRQPEPTAADKFNEMTKKQDDANQKQDETNKTLSMIHDVLQSAFA